MTSENKITEETIWGYEGKKVMTKSSSTVKTKVYRGARCDITFHGI